MLTEQERERFMRQIVMPGIGEEGQEILKNAKVLVCLLYTSRCV